MLFKLLGHEFLREFGKGETRGYTLLIWDVFVVFTCQGENALLHFF